RFVATICLWAVLAGACFSYGFLRHSSALYLALFLLVGWYFVIPSLLTVVSVTWFVGARSEVCEAPNAERSASFRVLDTCRCQMVVKSALSLLWTLHQRWFRISKYVKSCSRQL